jgi:hypothetical protein
MRNKTLVGDRLDGSSNFNSWNSRLQITLEEDKLLSLIEKTLPATTIDEEKAHWKANNVKARKIIIYSVIDHLLPHISTLKTTYEMYDALKKMFESNNTKKALTLKHQLQNLKMKKVDTIATFFMKILEIRDQLGAIGETITDRELVMITLDALPRHWEPFLQSISDHFFKVSVEEQIYLSLIVYGQTALRRKLDLSPKECKTPIRMTVKLLLLMQREAEGIEEVSAKHSKTRKLQQLQVMKIEKTIQRFNVSDVTSMDTLREIVLPGRKKDNIHPLQMLIQNHLREMKT